MLVRLRQTIQEWLDAGVPLERIEAEVIDTAPLDEERRAALWLYAWSHRDQRPRRSAAPAVRHDAVH